MLVQTVVFSPAILSYTHRMLVRSRPLCDTGEKPETRKVVLVMLYSKFKFIVSEENIKIMQPNV